MEETNLNFRGIYLKVYITSQVYVFLVNFKLFKNKKYIKKNMRMKIDISNI